MTSMAMWLQYHGIATLPPPEMIAALRGSGAMSGAYLKYNTPHLVMTFPDSVAYDGWIMRDNPQMVVKLRQFVRTGNPVCARVDFNPHTNAHEQHWVIVTQAKDDDFWIVDPHLGRGGWVSELYGIRGTDIIECLFYRVKSGFKRQNLGIDLSHHNYISSYDELVKKNRVSFAFIRGAYGKSADKKFHTHCNGLKSAEIGDKLGAYFFLVADEAKHPINQQVETWLRVWNERDDLTAFAVDVEDRLLTENQVKRCYQLLEPHNLPLVDYSTTYKWKTLAGGIETGNVKWTALYPRHNFKPPRGADIWQYSEYGTLHGCASVDLNLLIGEWPKTSTPQENKVDVWAKMCGNSTPYMVDIFDKRGSKYHTERYQNIVEGNRLYITKGEPIAQWECYELRSDGIIYQVRDTSPTPENTGGIPHYYDVTQSGGYCPRYMSDGQVWKEPNPHKVTFYRKSDGHVWDALPSGWSLNKAACKVNADGTISVGNPDGEMQRYDVGRVGWDTPDKFVGRAKSARLSADTTGDYPNVREVVASPKKKPN